MVKNRFDEHGSRDQGRQQPGGRGHDRDQRVAVHVPKNNDFLRQSLGPGGPHVVLAQVLQHARPHEARNRREADIGGGQHGQEHVVHVVREEPPGAPVAGGVQRLYARGREPVEELPVAQEDDQQHAHPEGGHGPEDEGTGRKHPVRQGILLDREPDAEGQSHQVGDDDRDDVDLEGDGQPLDDPADDGLVVLEGTAEIQRYEAVPREFEEFDPRAPVGIVTPGAEGPAFPERRSFKLARFPWRAIAHKDKEPFFLFLPCEFLERPAFRRLEPFQQPVRPQRAPVECADGFRLSGTAP